MMEPRTVGQVGIPIDPEHARPEEIARIAYYRVVARRQREGKATRIRLRG